MCKIFHVWGRGLRPPFFMQLNHSKLQQSCKFTQSFRTYSAMIQSVYWEEKALCVSLFWASKEPRETGVTHTIAKHLVDEIKDFLGIRNAA